MSNPFSLENYRMVMEAYAAAKVREALQSPEIQQLREAAKELADWAEHEVGAEPERTPGLQAIRALIPK